MPTYAYACTECKHHFEIVQSFTDDSLSVCPQCEGRLRKLFNAVGVVFKGSGFYRTDSRSSGRSSTTGTPATGERSGNTSASSPKETASTGTSGGNTSTTGGDNGTSSASGTSASTSVASAAKAG